MIDIPTGDTRSHRDWYRLLRDGQTGDVYDTETALRILRITNIHPADVWATVHTTRHLALLSARADREIYGHPTLGVANVEGAGWIAVIDLRPALAKHGILPTLVRR